MTIQSTALITIIPLPLEGAEDVEYKDKELLLLALH